MIRNVRARKRQRDHSQRREGYKRTTARGKDEGTGHRTGSNWKATYSYMLTGDSRQYR